MIANADKLRAAARRPRRWEDEQARLEANLKHWELEAYKKAQGFEGLPDPFPGVASAAPASTATRAPQRLAFWERFAYACLGAYVGASTTFLLPQDPAAGASYPAGAALLVVVANVLTTGVLLAGLRRWLRTRVALVLAGAIAVSVVGTLLALVFAAFYLASGQPLQTPR